jgi:hypothetical protein
VLFFLQVIVGFHTFGDGLLQKMVKKISVVMSYGIIKKYDVQ